MHAEVETSFLTFWSIRSMTVAGLQLYERPTSGADNFCICFAKTDLGVFIGIPSGIFYGKSLSGYSSPKQRSVCLLYEKVLFASFASYLGMYSASVVWTTIRYIHTSKWKISRC